MLVAFKLQHRIHNVFQYLRSGDAAFLVDVTDENDRSAGFFGKFQQRSRTLPYLHDAAGRRINVFRRDGLDGVDDDQVGGRILDVGKNLFQRGLTRNQQVVVVGMGDTDRAELQLAGTFFSRYIQDSFMGEAEYGLQDQGRFSNTGFAANQGQRALHQSSSQDPVEFFVSHIDALFFVRGDFL